MSGTERGSLDAEQGWDGHTVDLDDVFGVLAAQRRRAVVHALADADGAVDASALIERVVGWEREVCAETPANHADRVAVSVRHAHLPKLDALGVVEYDRRSDSVRFDRRAAFEEWIDHAAALSLPGSL